MKTVLINVILLICSSSVQASASNFSDQTTKKLEESFGKIVKSSVLTGLVAGKQEIEPSLEKYQKCRFICDAGIATALSILVTKSDDKLIRQELQHLAEIKWRESNGPVDKKDCPPGVDYSNSLEVLAHKGFSSGMSALMPAFRLRQKTRAWLADKSDTAGDLKKWAKWLSKGSIDSDAETMTLILDSVIKDEKNLKIPDRVDEYESSLLYENRIWNFVAEQNRN